MARKRSHKRKQSLRISALTLCSSACIFEMRAQISVVWPQISA